MQSIRRQIRRGHAIITIDSVTSLQVIEKRGTSISFWRSAMKYRSTDSENNYINMVTLPLSEKEIFKSKDRLVFKRP